MPWTLCKAFIKRFFDYYLWNKNMLNPATSITGISCIKLLRNLTIVNILWLTSVVWVKSKCSDRDRQNRRSSLIWWSTNWLDNFMNVVIKCRLQCTEIDITYEPPTWILLLKVICNILADVKTSSIQATIETPMIKIFIR